MPRTYNAEEVDPLLNDLFGQVETALGVAEDAHEKLAQLRQLHSVELQKVASNLTPVLDPALVDSTLETLEDLAILSPEGREKIASDLIGDPNNALRFLTKVLTFSAAAPQEGSGIPKSASEKRTGRGSDTEDWGSVIHNGA